MGMDTPVTLDAIYVIGVPRDFEVTMSIGMGRIDVYIYGPMVTLFVKPTKQLKFLASESHQAIRALALKFLPTGFEVYQRYWGEQRNVLRRVHRFIHISRQITSSA